MWLLTREGRTHWILRHKFEGAEHEYPKKLYHLFKHFVVNDGLILPYCLRHRGSNHYTIQQMINLCWLIFAVLSVTMLITVFNNDIHPIHCQSGSETGSMFLGNATICMRKHEISVSLVCMFILCGIHFVHRLIFQRIHPNKLQMDLHALLSLSLSPLFILHILHII